MKLTRRVKKADVELVVAKARIFDKPLVEEQEMPAAIAMTTDSKLTLKLPFRFDEASPEEESYAFILDATVGGVGKKDEVRFRDTPGVTDSRRGFVKIEFEQLPPGEHTLEATVHADYGIGAWKSTEETVTRASATVSVPVTVHE